MVPPPIQASEHNPSILLFRTMATESLFPMGKKYMVPPRMSSKGEGTATHYRTQHNVGLDICVPSWAPPFFPTRATEAHA